MIDDVVLNLINHRLMKKNLFIIALVVVFTSCLSQRETALKKEKYRISQTAKKEIPQMLEKIPIGAEKGYGFDNREEFLNSKVGTPFKFYTIKNNQLAENSPYSVPIMVGKEFRAFATVDNVSDTLHIVDFGSTALAKEIQAVCNENKNLSFSGILRVYQIYSDFLVMTKNQEKRFIPLTSAKQYLTSIAYNPNQKLFTETQIINLLKK